MNKIKAALFGTAAADALGVPAEFMSREALRRKPITSMVSGGAHGQPAGTWSDDTSMMLCLMDSIAAVKKLDSKDIMERFVQWFQFGAYTPHGECFDCGNTCGRAIRRFLQGTPAQQCGGRDGRDNGNGSLMRILPLVFFIRGQYGQNWPENPEAMAQIQMVSGLTHAHPISVMACGIDLCIAEEMLQGHPLEASIEGGVQNALSFYEEQPGFAGSLHTFERVRDLGAFKALPEEEIRSGGFVKDTLEAALWCLLNSKTYEQCALKAVNLGSDTDTTAAVAGGLAGIAYGLQAIPEDWLDKLCAKEMLEDICLRFARAVQ